MLQFIHIHVYIYIHIYINIYVYTCIYIFIYIYTHVQQHAEKGVGLCSGQNGHRTDHIQNDKQRTAD